MLAAVVEAALEIKPTSLVVLDLRGISSFADRFVILSASTRRQVAAIADRIDERLAAKRVHWHHREGYPEAKWVLLDYGDLIIHIFDEETRAYYDLERLWRDAPVTRVLPPDPAGLAGGEIEIDSSLS